MAGKGSTQRPVDWDKFDREYDRIHGKKRICPSCGGRHIITYTSTGRSQCADCKYEWETPK